MLNTHILTSQIKPGFKLMTLKSEAYVLPLCFNLCHKSQKKFFSFPNLQKSFQKVHFIADFLRQKIFI